MVSRYIYMYVYVYMCVCVCVCVFSFKLEGFRYSEIISRYSATGVT